MKECRVERMPGNKWSLRVDLMTRSEMEPRTIGLVYVLSVSFSEITKHTVVSGQINPEWDSLQAN